MNPLSPVADLVALYPVLNDLPPDALALLMQASQRVALPAASVVFDEQQACRGFPFVLKGGIRVVKAAPNGRELPLYRVTPGETCVITSSCLLGHTDYNARGIAEEQTELLLLPRDIFEALLAHEPFRAFVFQLFSDRIADLMQLIEEVAFHLSLIHISEPTRPY